MNRVRIAFLSLAGAAAAALAVGEPASAPLQPTLPFLQIVREVVRPGQTARALHAHALALGGAGASAAGQASIGLVSLSGPEEIWYWRFLPHLHDLEPPMPANDTAETEGQFLVSNNRYLALYFPNLTYHGGFDWSQMRYLDAISIHVRPGHHLEYLEMRKIALTGHERGGLDTNLVLFKIISGEPGNTYLILRPMRALSDHDHLRDKGFGEPLTPEEDRRMVELQAAAVDHEDEQFFRVEPRLSRVPDSWAGADRAFWTGATTGG